MSRLILSALALLLFTKTAETQTFQVAVTSSQPGLDLQFLAGYAAERLSQCGKPRMLFSTNRVAGAIPIVIEVSTFKIEEEVKVIHGVNITEYYSVCELEARVKTVHGADQTKLNELLSFNEKETVLKKKWGTEPYESPTLVLDESLNFNSMFGKSVAGKVFDRLLQGIAKALTAAPTKNQSF